MLQWWAWGDTERGGHEEMPQASRQVVQMAYLAGWLIVYIPLYLFLPHPNHIIDINFTF